MPIKPPSAASTTASIRNCSSTSRSSAPIARRRPISRVRSVTLTSMMFMMPIPPTNRLTAATAPSRVVITLVVPAMVSASCLVSSTLKLSSSMGASLRRSRSRSRRLLLTRSGSLSSAMDTSKVFTRVLPVTRRCRVLSGISTMSSWSLPKAPWPLEPSRPMISHEKAFTRRCWPRMSGLFWNSSRCRVEPMMHTAAPARSSSGVNTRPCSSFQLPVCSQALVLPITLDDQLRPFATRVVPERASGATAAMPPICWAIAFASVSLNAGAAVVPGPMRCPARICSRLVPRPWICVCTARVAPLPRVTMVITALTPITMPRMVRNERSRLRRMERSASKMVLPNISLPSLAPAHRPRTAPRHAA